ncbi:MAG: arginine deiminase-related protein [Siphonobacter sp.]
MRSQSTSHLLMIRPVHFGFNEQTASSNAFQNVEIADQTKDQAQNEALTEFDEMVRLLTAVGVDVTVIEDTPDPHTPDSIFPNNWVSFHNNGTVITYPMQAENRRLERREDILSRLEKRFYINRRVDLSAFEKEGKFLEGTGSMVLDRKYKIAYACLSPRTDKEALDAFALQMNYVVVAFNAVDELGRPIYHTNVLMCIGDLFAVICLDAVPDPDERQQVRTLLESSGRQIIEISLDQVKQFAGNMLQVKNKRGEQLLIMSTRAYDSLTARQIDMLDDYCQILHCDLQMIENNGGGSARCMMAEIHLPEK